MTNTKKTLELCARLVDQIEARAEIQRWLEQARQEAEQAQARKGADRV